MSGTNGEGMGSEVDVGQLQAQLADADRQIENLTNWMNIHVETNPVPPDEIPADPDRNLMSRLARLLQ